ncbi:MAG: SRPBCC family protein [Chitinophagales bacterium]
MIDKDIRIASTPPGSFYLSEASYTAAKEKVFARSWQMIGDENDFAENAYLYPVKFMDGCLNEPLILSKDADGNAKLMSNVCTHRGFILIEEKMQASIIRCRYHGRCFNPDGSFKSMPEFDAAENFPTKMDDLASVQLEKWGSLYFASLFPEISLEKLLGGITERLCWFPFSDLKLKKELSKDYLINANWALYCDNYLEGFHIPYVHKSLNKVIDYGNYETHLFDYSNLQLGIAKEDDLIFDIPDGSPDHGKKVAAYYYWVFPNMMFNFYPWGLSLNIIRPEGKDRTRVSFITYVSDESKYNLGAGSDLNRVEMEDEEVVESVYKGLHSRLYFRGRYSPKMERGVHHFHLLMQQYLDR